jgi:hypothetical protein
MACLARAMASCMKVMSLSIDSITRISKKIDTSAISCLMTIQPGWEYLIMQGFALTR